VSLVDGKLQRDSEKQPRARARLPRMRYNYKGFWCDSVYDIEVNQRNDGKYVFVVTEPPNNPGTSVTDYGEHLATAVRRQHGLKPADLIWIEHHLESKDHPAEVFNLVRFLGMKGDSFRTPVWTRITEQAVEDLIAGLRNVEDLLPRRDKERRQRGMGLGR
jgi:hypothetical protein